MFDTTTFALGIEYIDQTGHQQFRGSCEVCGLQDIILISENERICHTCAEGMYGEEEPDY